MVAKGEPVLTYDETDLANEKRSAELKLQENEGSYRNSIQKNNESLGDISRYGAKNAPFYHFLTPRRFHWRFPCLFLSLCALLFFLQSARPINRRRCPADSSKGWP